MPKDNLDTFDGWDVSSSLESFFDEETTIDAPEESKEEKQKDKKIETSKEDEKTTLEIDKEEEEEEESFFDFGGDDDDDDDDDEKYEKEKGSKEETTSLNTLNFLKEKGLLEFELEEGEELTEEKAESLLEEGFEERVDLQLKEMLQDLPPIVKNLIQYTSKGGKPEDIISQFLSKQGAVITKDLDISKEENQIKVIKQKLTEEGYDEEYIETNIEFLKDSGKLEKNAEKVFSIITAKQEKDLQDKIVNQEKEKKNNIEKQRLYRKDVTDILNSKEEISGVKFSSKEKKSLPNYLSDKNIKLDNGGSITEMQKDLYEALQDKEKTLVLAKILKNGFDLSDFVKNVETKITKEVRKNLQNNNTAPKIKKSKDLLTYFD